jgi:type III pantothenate kinase
MLLTIDAGNTRTKWAVFSDDGKIMQQGACVNADLSNSLIALQNVSNVIVSNVAGEAHANQIKGIFASHNFPLHWFKSSVLCCDVINSYDQPQTLGSDRWAALIAAWQMQHAPCVVVNAGTAVTIDALVQSAADNHQGEFVGGMILPGLTLMQASLSQATAQLPKNNDLIHLSGEVFATSTVAAISQGALNAICGAIEKMISMFTEKYGVAPYVILSGGDAAIIQAHLSKTVTNQLVIVDHLVLTGLYLFNRSQL